ncbi:MAG: multidrug ABC transporter substrate-binding protein [Candidatus Wallbacteria bacterium HGW-Wallbacteria-1]|jgi:putative ABC transport system permease protein|uniref:Multidrug ABC transporter substrate-binding protein n=1 Tax=Candidatus Wallbacteria bacterium HGW-Wallbacteria-1 TaxID=2013854 RepID=A0A2N1PQT5_9BACT|nr:MAG: multidrug ABC transporter substrate-binding protein [Candidatus Wallbacteria bacterium HGW-Wallbacteria-1]
MSMTLSMIRVAFQSLGGNRLRALLSMLGIIIGVGAVVSLMAIGEGAQQKIMERITAMGSDLLIVRGGAAKRGGVRGGSHETLTVEDGLDILAQVQGVLAVTPSVQKTFQIKYQSNNLSANVLGVAPTYFEIRNHAIEYGRSFTDLEVESRTPVVLIGSEVLSVLFPGIMDIFGAEGVLGNEIKIKGQNFRVIGILKAKGDQGFFNPDESVVIPFTVAMSKLIGGSRVREIDVKVAADSELAKIQGEVEAVLRKSHRIREGGDDDFNVRNVAEMVETAASVTGTFTLLLSAVAAISLLVGGIGIMNIMLVTVTERIREIGIRKAIGARGRDIMVQFLTEATVLSISGGILGVIAGLLVAWGVSAAMSITPVFKTSQMLTALIFSGGVGIFFGWYPASRAAALDPIDALTRE